ncbi:sulfurtransferase complex subunit TusB [Buchnera aphidicola (Chaitoregma tattakana)]|uniref:sulfurtransferase complex subunit TusB n=1 Tax=Buchnera aphidicola TaxID=9 RepID=UPI0031B855BC
MLHIFINSPFNVDINSLCNLINKEDDIIAIQDGVIISLKNNIFLRKIISFSKNLYVLKEDLDARGLVTKISKNFSIVNYSDFVNLTVKNKSQIRW